MSIQTTLKEAFERREAFLAGLKAQKTDCYRLLCEGEASSSGIAIDIYGPVAILQHYQNTEDLSFWGEWVARLTGVRSVYAKAFVKDRSGQLADDELYSADPVWGERAEPEFVVTENNLKFWIRPYAGFSTGLFLDQRDNRQRIRDLAGARVLNLFAYTCAFSVYAAAGGAEEVTSIDVSRKYLNWGKQNFELNGLLGHRFIAEDALEFLRRAYRRKELYDVVIADPPSFGRSAKGAFAILKDAPTLVQRCVEVSKGKVFLSANHHELSSVSLQKMLLPYGEVEVMTRPIDFQPSAHPLAACLLSVGG